MRLRVKEEEEEGSSYSVILQSSSSLVFIGLVHLFNDTIEGRRVPA